MAWRLRFDGVNDNGTFATAVTFNIGTDAYVFETSMVLNALPSAGQIFGIFGRSGTASGFAITSDGRLAVYVTGTLRYQTAASFFIQDATNRAYRLEHDAGGAWRAYRDGTLFGSGTFSTSLSCANNTRLGTATGSAPFLSADVGYIDLQGPANAQKWDADLSGGTGSTLPTTSGSNQATLINFPTDNSQWINAGGATITATIAATMPQMTVGVASSVDAPSYPAIISFAMPQMSVAVSAGVVAPDFSASVAFTMPQMSVSVIGGGVSPGVSASVAVTMPQMSVSVLGDVVVSGNTAVISFTMPQMVVAVSAGKTTPVIASSVAFTMPQMTVQVLTGGITYYSGDGSHIELAAQSRNIDLLANSRHLSYTNQTTHLDWRA